MSIHNRVSRLSAPNVPCIFSFKSLLKLILTEQKRLLFLLSLLKFDVLRFNINVSLFHEIFSDSPNSNKTLIPKVQYYLVWVLLYFTIPQISNMLL